MVKKFLTFIEAESLKEWVLRRNTESNISELNTLYIIVSYLSLSSLILFSHLHT